MNSGSVCIAGVLSLHLECWKKFFVDWAWNAGSDRSTVDFGDCTDFRCRSRDQDLVCGVEIEESKFADLKGDRKFRADVEKNAAGDAFEVVDGRRGGENAV